MTDTRDDFRVFLGDLATWTMPVRGTDRFEQGTVAMIVPRRKRDGARLTAGQFASVVTFLED